MALSRTIHIEYYVDFESGNYRSIGEDKDPQWKPEDLMTEEDWENGSCYIKDPNDVFNDLTWKHLKWEESCIKMGGHSITLDPDDLPYTIESIEAFLEACAKLIQDQGTLEGSFAPHVINRSGNDDYYDPKPVLGNAVAPDEVVALLKEKD
jgi:hypothetical protein